MHETNKKFADDQRMYHEFSQYCKDFAQKRRERARYRAEDIPEILERCENYIEEQRRKNKPLTISGFNIALDIPQQTFNAMSHGEYDYILEEYRISHGLSPDCEEHDGIPLIPFSEIANRCRLLVQEQLETNCYTNRGNPAGSIFSLKCNFKWVEDQSPQTLNQTLVIADSGQAMKAIEMLNKK